MWKLKDMGEGVELRLRDLLEDPNPSARRLIELEDSREHEM